MDAGSARSARRARGVHVVMVVGLLVVAAACSPSEPSPSGGSTTVVTAPPSSDASSAPSVSVATPSATLERPLAGSGSIAIAREDGSLWIVDADGTTTGIADAQEGPFGFPAWSPDGKLIAAIRSTGTEAAIAIFDVERAIAGLQARPEVIFESTSIGPFYLSWTPDSKEVSFLANELDSLSLRIVPVDGSAPKDGSGSGSVIRTGAPLYYDWIGPDLLIAHIGAGPEAFLGEVGRNDAPVATSIDAPGAFRSVDVSGDGRFVGYVRAGTDGESAVVAAARDGSAEYEMPVFGMAAVDFAPTGGTLASIGPIDTRATPIDLPIGPLRVLDATTGDVRTLLEEPVVSFAWSPDGSTIAAIELVSLPGGSNAASASPAPSSAPVGRTEIRLVFVDAATGKVRSRAQVEPGPTYVNALMTYFDQYALSHRLWAPDSSSLLLPQIDRDGRTRVDVFFPDGDPPVSLEGEIGFWSP